MGTRLTPEGWSNRLLPMFLCLLVVQGCTSDPSEKGSTPAVGPVETALPPTPPFNADSAYAFVKKQVGFGPRVPGSAAHKACADWLVARLNEYGAQVIEQTAMVTVFTGHKLPMRNIIARFDTTAKERVLLFAHYDTRPFADKDDERKSAPIDGANDGGSGVGILLEIARHLATKEHGPGVDLLFTDVEDYGQPSGAMNMDESSIDTWALGSQYFSKNPHVPGYTARFGILLDMCGARDAVFYREAISMRFAPTIVNRVWKTAAALGHGGRFVQETKYFVGTDDHLPINERLRIPSIDIIEYNPGTSAFHPSWHTHEDNMDVIDPATLNAVGATVLEVVWKER